MHKPEQTEAEAMHERLTAKYRPTTPEPERGPGKQYEYLGDGKVLADGVETDARTLSEAERITAGEQFIKAMAAREGKSVMEIRRQIAEVAREDGHRQMEEAKKMQPPHLRVVGGNRHERRKEAALKRRG